MRNNLSSERVCLEGLVICQQLPLAIVHISDRL